jgi:hypothetical protein
MVLPERAYVGSKEEKEPLKKVLEYDPYTDMGADISKASKIIFVRQEYSLRDGGSLGLKGDFYLYLNATDEFLKGAEERFAKEFKTIKRAASEDEKKLIDVIKGEKDKAAEGFGSIFG